MNPIATIARAAYDADTMRGHIAVLLTQADTSDLTRRFPNDAQKVIDRLRPLRPDWGFRVYQTRDGELPEGNDEVAGVVITGSTASVNDPEPWIEAACSYIQSLHARRVPTVGLCFGHQLIAKALGGRVERAAAWGLGTGRVQLAQAEAWMQAPQAQLRLFAAHHDQVTRLPPGARLLGGDAFCPLGCFVVGGADQQPEQGEHMLGIQYHPELSLDFMRALLDHLDDALPAGVVARARPQIEEPVDADLFFRWMVNFMERAA